jgi:glycosyltransferase involved in cell wall biosynthesis
MSKVAIFVPVHNESEKLADTLSRVPKELNGRETELIIVDDHSTDGSAMIAWDFTSHVIVLEQNSGVGVATRRGLEYIIQRGGYQTIIKFDADGQHDLRFLPEMERRLREYDVVICSRFHPCSDQTHTPTDRILLNMIFVEMLRKITGWDLTDVRSGFMGFRFEDVRMFASDIIVPRYGIPMELLLRLWNRKPNARVFEIPHPAIYGGNISNRLRVKYSSEEVADKADRLHMAYEALLMVVESLQIPRQRILEMNGFSVASVA